MRDQRTVRVVIADDHDLQRRGLEVMLESESDIEVVGEAPDGALAISEVERTQPDVVLIEAMMPQKGGIEAIPGIKDACPNAGIIVFSLAAEPQLVVDALKTGASGYLLKSLEREKVISAVRSVARGEAMLDPSLISEIFERPYLGVGLTPREREVLELIAEGVSVKTIASRLGISERTVKALVASIYSRLRPPRRHGWVPETYAEYKRWMIAAAASLLLVATYLLWVQDSAA